MLPDYRDILVRIPELPKWYDENGVPRYDDFHPLDVPNIYAKEAMLFRIECQACGKEFDVALSWTATVEGLIPLSEYVRKRRIHYGDPPRHGSSTTCLAGDTMNCIDRQVLEFWQQNKKFDWVRVPGLEGIDLEDGWLDNLDNVELSNKE